MKKSPVLYLAVLAVWALCLALLGYSLAQVILGLDGYAGVRLGFIIALLVVNSAILATLWFGSIKDFLFSLTYAFTHKRLENRYEELLKSAPEGKDAPRVLLLYCTCNDFNGEALAACMEQQYSAFRTVILDDSSDMAYLREVDEFAARHRVEVVRREDHSGYKAGNLNHFLRGRTDYDYFVVLDSDEVIPPDYITRALGYFRACPTVGALQARHIAGGGTNAFQRLMGLSVGSNGATVQIVKNFFGANALIGHGMAISRACYEKTGGFPHVVAEDISFAVEVRNAGFDMMYAPDIVCREEFPVSYAALKKRQCKWTQGNLEYMKKYHRDILTSRMRWFEKLDIMLSHYSLPIVPVLSFLLVMMTIALGFLGYPVIRYSLGIYCIMTVFLCSPMIPDLFVYHKGRNLLLLIPYFIVNIATYASLAPMMLRTVLCGLFGRKAVFTVTPKMGKKYSLAEILRVTADSLVFGAAVVVMSFLACHNVLPVFFIVAGCALAPFVMALSNIPVDPNGAAREVRKGAQRKHAKAARMRSS